MVVGGAYSYTMSLEDMVFQGTVWGPPLWNSFYKDARQAVRDAGFVEEVYADDLNAYKAHPNSVKNEVLLEEGKLCQKKLHSLFDCHLNPQTLRAPHFFDNCCRNLSVSNFSAFGFYENTLFNIKP